MSTEQRLAVAIAVLPELQGGRAVERLGGITNDNFKVESPSGKFVVRIDAPDGDVLEIDRNVRSSVDSAMKASCH